MNRRRILPATSHDDIAINDEHFFKEWQQGRIPFFGALLRARQILRARGLLANPISSGDQLRN